MPTNTPLSRNSDVDLRQGMLRDLEFRGIVDSVDDTVLALIQIVESLPASQTKFPPFSGRTSLAKLVKDVVAAKDE